MTMTKTFDYQSADIYGKRTKGKVDAPNAAAAAAMLKQQGVVPLDITEAGKGMQRELKIPGLGDKTSLKDLSVFARQFATLTASGMSLLRSLSVLEDQTERVSLKKAIHEVRIDIEGGVSLSAALGKHDRVFPLLMVSMIRAGETGGFLDSALEQIAVNLEKDAALRGKIKSTMTYPVIVLLFSLVMIAGVLTFIVPIFEDMFKQVGGELPLPTKLMVTASHNMAWLGPLVLICGIGARIGIKRALRTKPAVRLAFDQLKLKAPVFGPLFTKIAISRFSRNLGTLLGAGVPVTQALDVVGATTGNSVISNAMKELQVAVRDGETMSSPLANHPVFPSMVVQMIQVGEESGQIMQMLEKIADFYDREVDTAAESLTSALEPLMVLLMGLLVGSMVVCLYLPMFSIYQHIGV